MPSAAARAKEAAAACLKKAQRLVARLASGEAGSVFMLDCSADVFPLLGAGIPLVRCM
jgi:hypothetical protein